MRFSKTCKKAIASVLVLAVCFALCLGCTEKAKNENAEAPEDSYTQEDQSASLSGSDTQEYDRTVYITDTGSRYHRKSCGSLYKSSHAVTLSEAISRNYTPCKKCNP